MDEEKMETMTTEEEKKEENLMDELEITDLDTLEYLYDKPRSSAGIVIGTAAVVTGLIVGGKLLWDKWQKKRALKKHDKEVEAVILEAKDVEEVDVEEDRKEETESEDKGKPKTKK